MRCNKHFVVEQCKIQTLSDLGPYLLLSGSPAKVADSFCSKFRRKTVLRFVEGVRSSEKKTGKTGPLRNPNRALTKRKKTLQGCAVPDPSQDAILPRIRTIIPDYSAACCAINPCNSFCVVGQQRLKQSAIEGYRIASCLLDWLSEWVRSFCQDSKVCPFYFRGPCELFCS